MAGRPRAFNENDVLNKAIDIFWSRGFEATSTEDLLMAMDINRGSLYHTFGSKKELFVTSLNFFISNVKKEIHTKVKEYENPIEGLKSLFISLTHANYIEHDKGCFMGNSLAELSNIDDELKTKIAKSLIVLEDIFYNYILEAKEKNLLENKESPRVLARYLLNIWNGINITRRVYPNKEDLDAILSLQLSLLR